MSSIQTSLLNLVVAFMLIVSGHNDVRADDCGGISCSCVRGARTFTCPNGSVIDVCDDCSSSSGSSGSGNGGAGLIKLVGGLIGVAIFVPGFVVSPAFAIEVFWGAWGNEHPFGDRRAQIAAAKEKWEAFDKTRKDLEARGHAINVAKLEVETDLKDAVKQQTFPPLSTAAAPLPKQFWWSNMPRLVPNRDIECKAAGLEFPFRMLPGERIGSFADRTAMMTACGSRIERPVTSSRTDANGSCLNAGDLRCMHPGVCCPQGHGVYNAIDQMCYRDMDYRHSIDPEAQRYLGGEYCPASSP